MKVLSCTSLILSALLTPLSAITANAIETEIATLIRNHPQQRRSVMGYDSILNMVARAKAFDMANRKYFAHVDLDGYGPNRSVQLAGYKLPTWWGSAINDNYIESVGAGNLSAQAIFNSWMASSGHRQHLLAEHPFYTDQTRYGVGYAEVPGSVYVKYYVVLTAPPNPDGDSRLEPYSEWLFSWFRPAQLSVEGDSGDSDHDGIPRIIEFALGYDPRRAGVMPYPVLNRSTGRLEWTLPVRADLGSLVVKVEHSTNLAPSFWSSSGVQNSANTWSIPLAEKSGFMRLSARKQ